MGLRRGAIDFVDQHDVGEQRPGLEAEAPFFLIVDGDADDVGRQEIGGALNAAKIQANTARKRERQGRLADARHVFKQDVAARKQRHDRQLDGAAFAANRTFDIFNQSRDRRRRLRSFFDELQGQRLQFLNHRTAHVRQNESTPLHQRRALSRAMPTTRSAGMSSPANQTSGKRTRVTRPTRSSLPRTKTMSPLFGDRRSGSIISIVPRAAPGNERSASKSMGFPKRRRSASKSGSRRRA